MGGGARGRSSTSRHCCCSKKSSRSRSSRRCRRRRKRSRKTRRKTRRLQRLLRRQPSRRWRLCPPRHRRAQLRAETARRRLARHRVGRHEAVRSPTSAQCLRRCAREMAASAARQSVGRVLCSTRGPCKRRRPTAPQWSLHLKTAAAPAGALRGSARVARRRCEADGRPNLCGSTSREPRRRGISLSAEAPPPAKAPARSGITARQADPGLPAGSFRLCKRPRRLRCPRAAGRRTATTASPPRRSCSGATRRRSWSRWPAAPLACTEWQGSAIRPRRVAGRGPARSWAH